MNSRIAAVCAILVLFCTTAVATPAPKASWASLSTLARSIDTAAQRGDWTSAQRLSEDLSSQWTAKRPTVLHGLKGKAYAQSFDASLKWVSSAIAQRDVRNVHNAVANVEKSVHELQETAPRA